VGFRAVSVISAMASLTTSRVTSFTLAAGGRESFFPLGVEVAAGWAVCETAMESTTSFMETEAAGGAATAGPD